MKYVYQHKEWPNGRWNAAEVSDELAELSMELGKFLGRLSSIGFAVQKEAVHEMLSTEILESAAIEGEKLNRDDVRSSVARRMELFLSSVRVSASHEAEARAELAFDATRNWKKPMTRNRMMKR